MTFFAVDVPQEKLQSWQTPKVIFDELNKEFNFSLDAFASKDNALCDHFLTEEDDAFNTPWRTNGWVFANPPYEAGSCGESLTKAIHEVRVAKSCEGAVLLVPMSATKWLKRACLECEVQLFAGGRISFCKGNSPIRGNNAGSVLIIVRPSANVTGVTGFRDHKTGKLL